MLHEKTKLNIYLIRHGEAEINTDPKTIAGQSRTSRLTELGRLQGRAVGRRLREEANELTAVFSTPILRGMETTMEALKAGGFTNEIVPIPALEELSQGDWEGKPRSEIHTPQMLAYMNRKGDTFVPTNGQSLRMLRRQIANWFDEAVLYNPKFIEQPANVAIFDHKMVQACLLQDILGYNSGLISKFDINNASLTHLYFDKQGWWIRYINDFSHTRGLVVAAGGQDA